MARRLIGQEWFTFEALERKTDLDALLGVIDWSEADRLMNDISTSALGEQG